ncbi:hypothetical protein KKF61_07835 [Patescibacteria group bacterium]|nr:hypothetical protein [Patescibacteria group bacterium]
MSDTKSFDDSISTLVIGDKEVDITTKPATVEEIKESIREQHVEVPRQILPSTGTIFSIGGVMYKVTYVNNGKERFSANPVR